MNGPRNYEELLITVGRLVVAGDLGRRFKRKITRPEYLAIHARTRGKVRLVLAGPNGAFIGAGSCVLARRAVARAVFVGVGCRRILADRGPSSLVPPCFLPQLPQTVSSDF